MNEKGVEHDVTYIDLKNKPDWFLRLSPLGKVPVLRVGQAVLFESMVICEYLDEVHPPSLHPSDPLRKALNRAWTEFSSELLVDLYRLVLAKTRDEFGAHRESAQEKLKRLEGQTGAGPFFNGADFSLLDAAIAPAFMRIDLLNETGLVGLMEGLTKTKRWSEAILLRESVRTSVVPEFPMLFRDYLKTGNGYLAQESGRG